MLRPFRKQKKTQIEFLVPSVQQTPTEVTDVVWLEGSLLETLLIRKQLGAFCLYLCSEIACSKLY